MLNRVPSDLPTQVEDVMNKVIGACIEVHRHLGPGFLEAVYQRAVCIELDARGIAFRAERRIESSTGIQLLASCPSCLRVVFRTYWLAATAA